MATTHFPELQKEFLSVTRKGQEYALDAIKAWVEIVQSVTPKVPVARFPFAARLPKPEAIVAGTYDFADQLLANQRHFAEEVLKLTAPLRLAGGRGTSVALVKPEPEAPAEGTNTTAPKAPATSRTHTTPKAPTTK